MNEWPALAGTTGDRHKNSHPEAGEAGLHDYRSITKLPKGLLSLILLARMARVA
ncbi:MAG: hypothetical protein WAN35_15040 [Terracidiphilus sp.]